MIKSINLTSEQKINLVRKSKAFKSINALNVHVSVKAREIRNVFDLSLIECSVLFNTLNNAVNKNSVKSKK